MVAASLAGCAFFAGKAEPAASQQGQTRRAVPSAERVQLAALPGYLSDEGLVPARAVPGDPGVVAPARLRRKPALAGVRSRPSAVVSAAATPAPAPALDHRRGIVLSELVQGRRPAPITPSGPLLSARFNTLADLMVDHAWRRRTARSLERLFR